MSLMEDYKTDNYSADADLNLDEVCADYIAEECKNDKCSKVTDSIAYPCPESKKELKSISGVRGHILKKNEQNLRAAYVKKGPENNKQAARTERCPDELEKFHEVYPHAYRTSLHNLQTDPMYNIFGNSKLPSIAKGCVDKEPVLQYFKYVLEKCFKGNRISTDEERELFFNTLHLLRTNKELIDQGISVLRNSIEITGLTTMDVNIFIQDFIMDLVGEIFRHRTDLST